MNKKIVSLIGTAALALALASCSGDLHDVVMEDPDAMKGNWFYYELDTSAASDTISIIFNDGSIQTSNIEGVQKSGAVWYVWQTAAADASTSTRDDNPNKGLGNSTNKLGVYVFTDASPCKIYAWDDNNKFAGEWSGTVMNSDTAATETPSFFVKGIKLVGYDEPIGDAGYIAFMEGWMPNNAWDVSTPNKVTKADAKGNYVLTFDSIVKVEDSSLKLQAQNPDSDADFWSDDAKVFSLVGGTLESGVPSSVDGKTVTVVATFIPKETWNGEINGFTDEDNWVMSFE